MIRRFIAIAAALSIGAAVCAGLYWVFLNTPESNSLTLTASALLAVAFSITAAVTVNAALLVARGVAFRAAFIPAGRGVLWFWLALIPLAAGWWTVGRIDAWFATHTGEINGWFIAQFGWADVTQLFTAQTWASRWLRFAVFPVLSLSLLATLLTNEGSSRGASFLRRAWHWRTLAVATLVFIVLFALPWQLTTWRPKLPATWIEPAVAAIRLAIVLALALTGAVIMILVSARDPAAND